MKKILLPALIGLLAVAALPLLAQPKDAVLLPLYPGPVPNARPGATPETTITLPNGGVRIANVSQPTLTVFLPPRKKATGTAVIICPGGGYARLSIDHEGYDVARRLNEMGVAAFVLKYRLPNDVL